MNKENCSKCFYYVNSTCWVLPEATKQENATTLPRTYATLGWGYLGICGEFFIPEETIKQLVYKRLKLYKKEGK